MTDYKIIGEILIGENLNLSLREPAEYYELVEKLRLLYREEYSPNERIIIHLVADVYDYPGRPGKILTLIQKAINELDISNCFVLIRSGNERLDKEVVWLADNLSHDKTPMNFEILDEEFGYHPKFRKVDNYNDTAPIKIDVDSLSEKHKDLLTKNSSFCIYPWIHLHSFPTGEAQVCCMTEYNEPVGNLREQTMQEVWNGDKMKEIRRNMLAGLPNASCARCYEQEKSGFMSGRISANKHHGHHIERVEETKSDGSFDRFEMTYWDIRFSNLCNLSCRSCGHIYSSSWYQDQVKLAGKQWGEKHKPLFWAGRYETDMLEQLMEHIDYVEQIYFAGGEPLMMDEHYQILEELERRGKFNVRLIYNTNFTKTKLKDRYVFDYWRKFDSVAVGASLDAMGERAEYIRKGTKWEEVENNRRMMMEQCPNVDFYISPTLSIMNALHLPDFHKNWVEKGLIKPMDLNVNILQDPPYYRIDIAPDHYKQKIIEKFEEHLRWLRPLDPFKRATKGFESSLNFLKSENKQILLPKFWEKTNQLDGFRKENILEIIPELNELR